MRELSLPTLLLLPGLGADRRFFQPQLSLPMPVKVIEWIEPESRRESLHHYCQRLADHIGPQPNAFVGGNSMGALAALELASLIEARGVLVIGGCWSHRQISPLFRFVLGAGAMMPTSWIRPTLVAGPLALKLFEGLSAWQVDLMMRMLREHPPRMIQWSCRALLDWECCTVPPAVPVHAIHGTDDQVIPAKNVKPQAWVAQGHHLISLSRPEAVNAFVVERVTAEEAVPTAF